MVGCFPGLIDDPGNPYHVPPERLTESHPCVDVCALAREGLLVVGASGTLQMADGGCRRLVRGAGNLTIDGALIPIRPHPTLPMLVFGCPRCGTDRYKLHEVAGVWACRKCHGLDFASRHKHRSVPALHRISWLRRRIGADPRPFTALPAKPLHWRRHLRLAREIRRLEARLVEHGEAIASVLEKRHDRS